VEDRIFDMLQQLDRAYDCGERLFVALGVAAL
jgi:hypothetical protein